MRELLRYDLDDPHTDMVQFEKRSWVRWDDVEALLAQLPEGMKHCTFEVLECGVGHTRLHATNWIDHGCQTCLQKKLREELQEMTANALAAVWLIPDDETPQALRNLRDEAREVFMGKDKETIAKLQDKLRYAQEAYQHVTRPSPPGVGSVYARDFKKNIDIPLGIFEIRYDADGHAHIGVYLP